MSTSRKRRLTGVLAVVLAAGTGVAVTSGTSSAHPRDKTLDLQILSFNDFHGNLEAPGGSSGRIVTDHQLVGGKDHGHDAGQASCTCKGHGAPGSAVMGETPESAVGT